MIKVVILVSYTYPHIGSGIGQVALLQAEGLASLGYEVVLVSGNVPSRIKRKFKKNKVLHLKIRCINYLAKFHIPVPLFFLNLETIGHIRNADVVHVHGMLYPYSLQAAILAKKYKKPFVLTQHAGYIKYPNFVVNFFQQVVKVTVGKVVLGLSSKVIVVNEEVKNWLGLAYKKAITLTNGVDTSIFFPVSLSKKKVLRKKHSLPRDKNIVLFVGRLVPKKGFLRLYEARDKNYLIVFVGGGEQPEHMKQQKEEVVFLGALSQKHLSEIYQLSDLFVLPSDSEGFPLSIQEAMASGLPIITSKHPGFEKYLDEKYVSFVNPSARSIKKAILAIIANKSLRKKMSMYSRQEVISKVSWKNNVQNLLKIYQEALL